MLMLIKHPEIRDKILAELDAKIIQPHLKSLPHQGNANKSGISAKLSILDFISFENQGDLDYYSNCHNESLRIQPPVYFSSSIMMMRDCQCDYLKVRKGDCISIDIYRLHHNPAEWHHPERFIPDRFDSQSPYYQTPRGT